MARLEQRTEALAVRIDNCSNRITKLEDRLTDEEFLVGTHPPGSISRCLAEIRRDMTKGRLLRVRLVQAKLMGWHRTQRRRMVAARRYNEAQFASALDPLPF